MRVIKFGFYCLFAAPKIIIYELLKGFAAKPFKRLLNCNMAFLYAALVLVLHLSGNPAEQPIEQRTSYRPYSSKGYNPSDYYIDRPYSSQNRPLPSTQPVDREPTADNEFYTKIMGFFADKDNASPIFFFFLGLSFIGGTVQKMLFRKGSPRVALKAKYHEFYPKRNKIVVVPKSKNKGENLKSITSRLPPHLQELISKK